MMVDVMPTKLATVVLAARYFDKQSEGFIWLHPCQDP